jgi:hypothetical protein
MSNMTPSPLARLAPRLITLAAAALFLVGIWWLVTAWQDWRAGPTPETVVAASLEGLREQNVLVPFTARYVAVVTSRQTTLGITAQKTLIMPGTVRYELDLGALSQRDLSWDAAARTLTVTLPPLRLAGPEIDLSAIREYRDGELLLWLTDAEQRLDAANERAATRELLAQARGETPLRLARGAAIRAVTANFAMPLRAAGIDATVTVRFR